MVPNPCHTSSNTHLDFGALHEVPSAQCVAPRLAHVVLPRRVPNLSERDAQRAQLNQGDGVSILSRYGRDKQHNATQIAFSNTCNVTAKQSQPTTHRVPVIAVVRLRIWDGRKVQECVLQIVVLNIIE